MHDGVVFGPQVYAFNFTSFGIRVVSGHEVTVTGTWVGEYWWGTPNKENGTASTATGISVEGNDHVVTDCVVFSSHVGIAVSGGADFVGNVHTWNLATDRGGTGILVNASQTRVDGAYLDWNDLVVLTPRMVSISNGFYLCGGHIQLVAPADGTAASVFISNNQLIGSYCHFSGCNVVEAVGTFTSAQDVTVFGTLAQASAAGARRRRRR